MCSPTTRASTSVGPPAANGTMMVIGRTGYVCAAALPCASKLTARTLITKTLVAKTFARKPNTASVRPIVISSPRLQSAKAYRNVRPQDNGRSSHGLARVCAHLADAKLAHLIAGAPALSQLYQFALSGEDFAGAHADKCESNQWSAL